MPAGIDEDAKVPEGTMGKNMVGATNVSRSHWIQ